MSPESIWLTKTGDWRLGGFGLALSIPAGQYGVASPYFANEGAIGGELTGEPKLEYTSPELTKTGDRVAAPACDVFLWAACCGRSSPVPKLYKGATICTGTAARARVYSSWTPRNCLR